MMKFVFFYCIASSVLLYSYPEERALRELHPLDTNFVKDYIDATDDSSQSMVPLPDRVVDSSGREYMPEEYDPYDSLSVKAYIECMGNLCQAVMSLPNCVVDSSNPEYIHVLNVHENWSIDVRKIYELDREYSGYLIRFSSIEYVQGKSPKKIKKEFIDKYKNFPQILFKCNIFLEVGVVHTLWKFIDFHPRFNYNKYFFNLKNAVMIYREYVVGIPYNPAIITDNCFYYDIYYVYYQDGSVVEYKANRVTDAIRPYNRETLTKRVLNE